MVKAERVCYNQSMYVRQSGRIGAEVKQKCYMESPVGTLCLIEEDACIAGLYLEENNAERSTTETPLLKQAKQQLCEYFNGTRKEFTLPIKLEGTEFQLKVWKALQTIPYGETRSYGEIAAQIGKPKAARAVGGANNKNHIIILVPCHRVIGADGRMVGFGCGLDVKEYLLKLEQKGDSRERKEYKEL